MPLMIADGCWPIRVERAADAQHLRVQRFGARVVARHAGAEQADVQRRKMFAPPQTPPWPPASTASMQMFLGTDEQRPVRAPRQEIRHSAEVGHVAGTVFQPDDARLVHRARDGLEREGHFVSAGML